MSFCSGDITARYQLSDSIDTVWCSISQKVGKSELHARTTSIPYTKITSIHYQTLSKKVTTWKTDANNLSVCLLKGLLSLNFDKHDNFTNKHKKRLQPYHQKRFNKNQWHASYAFCSRYATQKQLRWAK